MSCLLIHSTLFYLLNNCTDKYLKCFTCLRLDRTASICRNPKQRPKLHQSYWDYWFLSNTLVHSTMKLLSLNLSDRILHGPSISLDILGLILRMMRLLMGNSMRNWN